ncbi:single-stranded DNA-binding protein [Capillibacterium thermochitinicola]|uniref:Single-stranded DNA-binding protein n=1 Tax=Capillibacterium thermochitinicola TaxID=2699427 RepID=A0A8J6I2J4_9FIRM|nr:single-stranded DNA-binding protein [Capillibacterium thermochitinicola]MBA2133087.1 single-stranded DNA-binding protein [Capillibacterium thermochitinicola]
MNHVILIGRLTRDPELRYTPNGVAVANFTLAVDRPFSNQEGAREADFIPVVVWQKLAETCANHLHKGRLVAVDGRLQIRSYETQDGQRRRVAEVVAANVQFLDRAGEARRTTPTGDAGSDASDDLGGDDFGEINLDDLPF